MSESPFPEITHPRQRAFLAAFRDTGNVRLACKIAKVGRSTHYLWLEKDASYREAFELAKEDAADLLEAEATRRAVEGVEEPVGWYKGKPGGYLRKYSDTLLIFQLKGLRPEKYRERMEVTGTLRHVDFTKLPVLLRQQNKPPHASVVRHWAAGAPFGQPLLPP